MSLDGFSLRCGSSSFTVGLTKHLVHYPISACYLSHLVCSCSAGQTIECEEVECDGDDCAEPLEQCPEEDPSLSGIFPLCGESFFGCQYGEVNCCPGQDPTPARSECPFVLLHFIPTVDSFFEGDLPCGTNVSRSYCCCCCCCSLSIRYHRCYSCSEACACTEGEAIQCTDQTSCATVLCPVDPLGPIPEPIDPEDKQPKECPATNPEELDSAAVCSNSYQGCKYDFKQCCKGQPPFLAVSKYLFVRQLFVLDPVCQRYTTRLTSDRFFSSILPTKPVDVFLLSVSSL